MIKDITIYIQEKRKASQTILEDEEENLHHIFSKKLNLDKSQEDDFSDDDEESHKNDDNNIKNHDITEQFKFYIKIIKIIHIII